LQVEPVVQKDLSNGTKSNRRRCTSRYRIHIPHARTLSRRRRSNCILVCLLWHLPTNEEIYKVRKHYGVQ
jgi:hypothetical protein